MDIQRGVDHIGTKPHDAQAHAIGFHVGRKTGTVVFERQPHACFIAIQGNGDGRGLTVAYRIVYGFLDDVKEVGATRLS